MTLNYFFKNWVINSTHSVGSVSINLNVAFDKQSFGKNVNKTYSEGIFSDLWSEHKEYKEAEQQEEESKDDLNSFRIRCWQHFILQLLSSY